MINLLAHKASKEDTYFSKLEAQLNTWSQELFVNLYYYVQWSKVFLLFEHSEFNQKVSSHCCCLVHIDRILMQVGLFVYMVFPIVCWNVEQSFTCLCDFLSLLRNCQRNVHCWGNAVNLYYLSVDILNFVGMFICTLLSHTFLRKFFVVRKVFRGCTGYCFSFFWAHPNKLFATYSFWLATLLSGLVTTVYREFWLLF